MSQQNIISLIQHLSEDIDDIDVKNAINKCIICISTQKNDNIQLVKESFMQSYNQLNDMIVIPEDLDDELNSLYATIGNE